MTQEQKRAAEMVLEIDEHGENLTKWEITFIDDMMDRPYSDYSEKRIATVKRIYEERMP